MKLIAPIIRRPVSIEKSKDYFELGIRSFGKGTFHKTSVKGYELGTKRVYFLEESDLLFSNVFAWEGAIALVKKEDKGRIGSHRFISCNVNSDYALPGFLLYHFLTKEGIRKIREASPGGAGRNRTLGLKKLEEIEVPLPDLDKQKDFIRVEEKFEQIKKEIIEDKINIERLRGMIIKEGFIK